MIPKNAIIIDIFHNLCDCTTDSRMFHLCYTSNKYLVKKFLVGAKNFTSLSPTLRVVRLRHTYATKSSRKCHRVSNEVLIRQNKLSIVTNEDQLNIVAFQDSRDGKHLWYKCNWKKASSCNSNNSLQKVQQYWLHSECLPASTHALRVEK